MIVLAAQIITANDGLTLVSLIREFGAVAAMLILCIYGIWKYIIPALVRRWDSSNTERQTREQAERNQLHEFQQYFINEVSRQQIEASKTRQAIDEERRSDQAALLQAYVAGTVSSTKMTSSIDQHNELLINLITKVSNLEVNMIGVQSAVQETKVTAQIMQTDISHLYRILGVEKRIPSGD